MNNLTANFNQVLKFAEEYGLPVEKKRGILREYLQSMFLAKLYHQPAAKKLIFTGGTSLRLLRNLNRFSEDLDFDNLGLTNKQIITLVNEAVKGIRKENIDLELKSTIKGKKTYFELKFPKLLFDLKISTNPREKLMIKVDYADFWQGQKPEKIMLNRYGFLEMVPVLPLGQALAEKLAAYVGRKETQGRDVYDVVWLYTQGGRQDKEFCQKNHLRDLVEKAAIKWQKQENKSILIRRLAPFLFDAGEAKKLELFGEVVKKLSSEN